MTFFKLATAAVLVPVIRTVVDVDRALVRWTRSFRALSATESAEPVDPKGRTPEWRRGVSDGRNIERAGVSR